MLVFLIIGIALIVLLIFLIKRSKKFKFDSIVMVNGGVGSGKTLTAVWLAIRNHKKSVKIWRRKNFFRKLMKKDELEKPLLYSNIPLFNYEFVLLTDDLLTRQKRFNFNSIVLISESSLIANSQDYKRKDLPNLNDDLTEFLKLIRHQLHGSYRSMFGLGGTIPNLICETQSKNDNHFAFDRCITQVMFINKSYNIPFFKLQHCRDLLLYEGVENVILDDSKEDKSFKWYFIPKSVFKKYDSYCYSFLTDNLESYSDTIKIIQTKKNKKKYKFIIPTFHKFIDVQESNDKLEIDNKKVAVLEKVAVNISNNGGVDSGQQKVV